MISIDTLFTEWLHPLGASCHCDNASLRLIDQLNEALDAGDYINFRTYFDSLIEVSDSLTNKFECAELLLWCGRAQYFRGDLPYALRIFQNAVKKFPPNSHLYGVANWAVGLILWQMPNSRDRAITTWRKSIENFENIVLRDRYLQADVREWYARFIKDLKQFLQAAISGKAVFQNRQTIFLKNGKISDFELDPKNEARRPSAILTAPETPAQIDQVGVAYFRRIFILEDFSPKTFFFYNIYQRTGNIVIDNPLNYRFIKISTDTLGDYGVQRNDYLLYRQQNYGRDGDILILDSQTETLRPYQDLQDQIYIKGRVVAILKPQIKFNFTEAQNQNGAPDLAQIREVDEILDPKLDAAALSAFLTPSHRAIGVVRIHLCDTIAVAVLADLLGSVTELNKMNDWIRFRSLGGENIAYAAFKQQPDLFIFHFETGPPNLFEIIGTYPEMRLIVNFLAAILKVQKIKKAALQLEDLTLAPNQTIREFSTLDLQTIRKQILRWDFQLEDYAVDQQQAGYPTAIAAKLHQEGQISERELTKIEQAQKKLTYWISENLPGQISAINLIEINPKTPVDTDHHHPSDPNPEYAAKKQEAADFEVGARPNLNFPTDIPPIDDIPRPDTPSRMDIFDDEFPLPANPAQREPSDPRHGAMAASNAKLHQILLDLVHGNEKKARNLVQYEREKHPNADLNQWLKNAIERWEYNNHISNPRP